MWCYNKTPWNNRRFGSFRAREFYNGPTFRERLWKRKMYSLFDLSTFSKSIAELMDDFYISDEAPDYYQKALNVQKAEKKTEERARPALRVVK